MSTKSMLEVCFWGAVCVCLACNCTKENQLSTYSPLMAISDFYALHWKCFSCSILLVDSSKDAFRGAIPCMNDTIEQLEFFFESFYPGAHKGSRQLEELVLSLDCFILARMSVIVILELGCAERKTTESINILYLIFRSLLFCDVSIVVLLHDSSFPPLICVLNIWIVWTIL